MDVSIDNKLRKMEEEMKRFETEIASQVSYSANALQVSQSMASYSLPYVPGSQFASSALIQPSSHYMTPSAGVYMAPQYNMTPTYMQPPQVSSQPAVVQAAPAVISAPPQVAAPSQLAAAAAAARASREAEAAAKMASADGEDFGDVDDDVTRALLAAAAGVTYNRATSSASSSSAAATTTKTAGASASAATSSALETGLAGGSVVPIVPSQTVVVPQSLLPTQIRGVTPAMRSKASSTSATDQAYGLGTSKKKVYKRVAAGMVWEDPTLADWDPDDFRLFCGDLGNEVNDDTLTRAFSRYASFQRARVVVDKRTGKSRGYGFVSFADPQDFTRAMREMNGKYVGNRPIKLKKSDWKSRQLETYRKKEKEKRKLGLRL